jgi:probable rRNA maturation factor
MIGISGCQGATRAGHPGNSFPAMEPMIVNQQHEIRLDLGATRKFVGQLRKCLRLGRRQFNVCFVGDNAMARLNAAHRGKARPTDVLSFPWAEKNEITRAPLQILNPRRASHALASQRNGMRLPREIEGREFSNFLGDIVISIETARRNARAAAHPVGREIRWLILHGALHLLGYDHENDGGEMTELEFELRRELKI